MKLAVLPARIYETNTQTINSVCVQMLILNVIKIGK